METTMINALIVAGVSVIGLFIFCSIACYESAKRMDAEERYFKLLSYFRVISDGEPCEVVTLKGRQEAFDRLKLSACAKGFPKKAWTGGPYIVMVDLTVEEYNNIIRSAREGQLTKKEK